MSASVPVVDIHVLAGQASLLSTPSQEAVDLARQVYDAFSEWGVFVCIGHGISDELQQQLEALSRRFFSLPAEKKLALHVQKGGPAWRGYMPHGGEYTHGQVDYKEGLYLGPELPADDPRVLAGLPLHGPNQFPDLDVPELRDVVLRYLKEVERLGHRLMELVCISLRLDPQFIRREYTKDPVLLFRLFNYPAQTEPRGWGIGEHTDYGLLTILKQAAPGLQFEHPVHGWVDVPALPNSFACNVGDLLDRMTEGRFKSRRHRARNLSTLQPRLSFPLFFDPSWDCKLQSLPLKHLPSVEDPGQKERWEKTAFVNLTGEYSQFLAKKVAKVFAKLEHSSASFEPARGPSTRFAISIPPS
jgi:isopenicillin N synthase-like dioxygenase